VESVSVLAVQSSFLAHRKTLALARRVAELRRQRDFLSRNIDGLHRSVSWYATSPLRWIGGLISRARNSVSAIQQTTRDPYVWMSGLRLQNEGFPLAIDVSRVVQTDLGTGILRVVRNIARELVVHSNAVALDLRNGALRDVGSKLLADGKSEGPSVQSFQRLLMLDGSWDIHRNLSPLWDGCHAAGIPVITCVYDLIPIDHASSTKGDLSQEFRGWLEASAMHSDAFVCISEATARRLESYIRNEFTGTLRARKIGWWHLGSELEGLGAQAGAQDFIIPQSQYVLCVGTFEPRKNQRFLLEAFNQWWVDQDYPVSLVFAGRDGWKTEDLIADIESHPEFGRRLWWFRGVDDDCLQELYRCSSAVVMASSAEGFGLPIVEGARFGKPIVLSDIPVFREIVDSHGYFFAVNDKRALRQAVDDALAPGARPTRVCEVSWRESAQKLRELIVGESYQIML
jgi:glycosyltransferase involved in cell wall biosynthesis